MWLKGDKLQPTFNYTLITRKGAPALLDEVKYVKKGKMRTITGYDTPDAQNPNAFTWRGKGLLSIAKSRWEVRLKDTDGQWAVIWFSKTLFTPEGIDVISRKKQLSTAEWQQIQQQMQQDPVLQKHLSSLQDLSNLNTKN